MSRFLKKYQSAQSFFDVEGEGKVVTSKTPGAAYVKDPEDEFVAYNEVELPEPPVNPDEPIVPDEPIDGGNPR